MTRSLFLGLAFIVVGCWAAPNERVQAWLGSIEAPDPQASPLVSPAFVAASLGQFLVLMGICFLCLDLRVLPKSASIWAVLTRMLLFLIFASAGLIWTLTFQFRVVFSALFQHAGEGH